MTKQPLIQDVGQYWTNSRNVVTVTRIVGGLLAMGRQPNGNQVIWRVEDGWVFTPAGFLESHHSRLTAYYGPISDSHARILDKRVDWLEHPEQWDGDVPFVIEDYKGQVPESRFFVVPDDLPYQSGT